MTPCIARCVLMVALVSMGGDLLHTQGLTSSQDNKTTMTGKELYKRLISPPEEGEVFRRDWNFVRDIFSAKLNNGVVPDQGTLYRLTEVLKTYLVDHKSEWGQPAEALIIKGLKDAPLQISRERAYWEKAIKAASEYFRDPSPELAKELFMALPRNRSIIDAFLDIEGENRLLNFIMDFTDGGERRHLSILENEIEAGEPGAIDVAFRLFNISDGMYSESLCFILGELLVPNHPRLFLQRASIHNEDVGQSKFWDHLECILRMGAEWGEVPEAGGDQAKYKQIYNERITRRIKALGSVNDPDLIKLRDQCISTLQEGFIKWP